MNEKFICLFYGLMITFLFSMNFNKTWINRYYERVKNYNLAWYWFRVFKIEETKENFIKFQKGISIFVISIMIISFLIAILR
jgi:hypothetical protein